MHVHLLDVCADAHYAIYSAMHVPLLYTNACTHIGIMYILDRCTHSSNGTCRLDWANAIHDSCISESGMVAASVTEVDLTWLLVDLRVYNDTNNDNHSNSNSNSSDNSNDNNNNDNSNDNNNDNHDDNHSDNTNT